MSTFIKVTQEGNKLLRLNAQQTQAARLGKVEADEQRRAKQQAQEARQQALLQQGKDANGEVTGDARRRRFRLDEPAATRIYSSVLLVTWNGLHPILSDRSAIKIYEVLDPGSFSTTISAGATVAAHGVSASDYSYWMYQTNQCRIKDQTDFTFEAWLQFTARSRPLAIIQIRDANSTAIDMRLFYVANDDILAEGMYYSILDPIDGFSSPMGGNTAVSPFQPQHICIMRKNGLFYWFINGYLMTINPSEAAQSLVFSGSTQIDFGIYGGDNAATIALGQLRLDPNRARYNPAGFTPDPLPFRP